MMNFRIPALSNSTSAIWVKLGTARWKGSDALGIPLPARYNIYNIEIVYSNNGSS